MSQDEDRLLEDALRAVRETYDGAHEQADLTLQRALFATRKDAKRRRLGRFALLPIAAALVVSTAWAGRTGHLGVAMQDLLHPERPAFVPPPVAPAVSAPGTAAPSSPLVAADPPPAPPVPGESSAAPASPLVAAAPAPALVAPAPAAAAPASAAPVPEPPRAIAAAAVASAEPPPPAATASAPDPNAALFAEAHRLHFGEKDPGRALGVWDAYLTAAPDGPLAPEAHYNRALCLVRLGRRLDAMNELAGFANGSYGSYRQVEAKALLDALAHADAGR